MSSARSPKRDPEREHRSVSRPSRGRPYGRRCVPDDYQTVHLQRECAAVIQNGPSMFGILADTLPRGLRADRLEESIPVWSWRLPEAGRPGS
jgi:hypothetical protein